MLKSVERHDRVELLEDPALPEDVAAAAYQDLARTHRCLGNTSAILSRLRRANVRSVLDLGCGHGALLDEIRRKLHLEVTGFDLRPVPNPAVPIFNGNAVTGALPSADATLAVCLIHHLSGPDIVQLVRNVSRSSKRFIILDPVRHWLPLALFRFFVAPFLHRINAADGLTSIRRSYTPRELRSLVDTAVDGTSARVRHTVAPLYIRQIVDIEWT